MPVVAEKKRPEKELRWSVRRKTDAVVRLLRGEDIDTLARELRVEAHRLAAWRDEFDSRWSSRSGGRRGEKGGCRSRPGSGRGERRHGRASGDRVPDLGRPALDDLRPGRGPGHAGQAGSAHGPGRRAGEGHRKVTARLRREHGIFVGRKRVLRLMRQAGLLAPQRARGRRRPRPHDGTIVPPAPNVLWGTDATMAYTTRDGWVWAFVAVDHYTAEAWATVARRGDRFAALEPIYDAVRGEPPCNGCAERFIRTLKEQCIWSRTWESAEELAQGIRAFVELYNTRWLIERLAHRTPREAYVAATSEAAA